MAKPRRMLTEVERSEPCPWCGAEPGQRCTNPSGRLYNSGDMVHVARRGMTAGIANRYRSPTLETAKEDGDG